MNKSMEQKKISIIGGGPVGSLLSIYLSRRSHKVEIYEKRPDLRTVKNTEGRSINLALSHRGLRALEEIGLKDQIKRISIPMKGRMIHLENGSLNFQPYGEKDQYINSISRNELNKILIEKAEESGVKFNFNFHCDSINLEKATVEFSNEKKNFSIHSDIVFGADGAFSEVRNSFKNHSGFSYQQEFLSHGYKELHIPSGKTASHLMEKHALHIWPREQFMLIALPNIDGSFTATLFLPFKGENSFEKLTTENELEIFFRNFFPDAFTLMPDLKKGFFLLPPSYLVTVHCFPWIYKDRIALIGDAAHAITPFYGQGMNAGFEDCRILNQIIDQKKNNWEHIFEEYQSQRKENADAIAELALQNFIEMRDHVNDAYFILRKKIEAKIHQKHPAYHPLYSMVTFSDLPYRQALLLGKEHDRMMNEVMQLKDLERSWEAEEGWKEIEKIVSEYIKKGLI
jgi:kynurenine 3-monooxygenase